MRRLLLLALLPLAVLPGCLVDEANEVQVEAMPSGGTPLSLHLAAYEAHTGQQWAMARRFGLSPLVVTLADSRCTRLSDSAIRCDWVSTFGLDNATWFMRMTSDRDRYGDTGRITRHYGKRYYCSGPPATAGTTCSGPYTAGLKAYSALSPESRRAVLKRKFGLDRGAKLAEQIERLLAP